MYVVVINTSDERLYVGKSGLVQTFRASSKFACSIAARKAAIKAKSRAPLSRVSIFRGLSRVESL